VKRTTVTCDRCKSPVTTFPAAEFTAGPLRKALPNALDLCEPCGERFKNWLRSGHPDSARFEADKNAPHGGPSGAIADAAVAWMGFKAPCV